MIISMMVLIVISLAIGFFGRNRRFGFLGHFLVSLLFTPLIGLLVLFAAYPQSGGRQQ
jgi:hypothetical protein